MLAGVNRLAQESSLYLRQHAENPVDWQPWGRGFARARAEDRPVLLSVGYSSPLVPRQWRTSPSRTRTRPPS